MSSVIEFIKKIIYKIISFFKKKKIDVSYQLKKLKVKNKNNKIKLFFTGFLGYIGSVIVSPLNKNKKEKEVDVSLELKKINKNILNIEKSIENETTPLVLKMYKKDINKKINKLKNIKNLKSREENKLIKDQEQLLLNIKNKITVCENKLKGIDYTNLQEKKFNDINFSEEKKVDKKIKNSNINRKYKKNSLLKNTKINTKQLLNKQTDKKEIRSNNQIRENTKKFIKKTVLVATIPFLAVTKNILSNKKEKENEKDKLIIIKIKKINRDINNIYSDISKVKNNSNNKENELFLIKEKVKNLKEEYLKLVREDRFSNLKRYKDISNIDPNHLVYHGRAIDNLIDYLENSIQEAKNNKLKKENINEINKTDETLIDKEILIDKEQIEMVKNSIKKDILLSKEEIKNIRLEIKNMNTNYKPTLLNKLSSFFKNSINIGISLIPFGIFKNRLLATLTSGIILNNRIRSMNSLFGNEEINFIKYENVLDNIKDKKSCLENTSYILLNTISEIDKLKGKIENMYLDMEAEKLLINLEEMKLDLLEENVKIETLLEETNSLEKQKIKRR